MTTYGDGFPYNTLPATRGLQPKDFPVQKCYLGFGGPYAASDLGFGGPYAALAVSQLLSLPAAQAQSPDAYLVSGEMAVKSAML